MRRRHWKHTTRHAGDENRNQTKIIKKKERKKKDQIKKTGTRKPNRSIKYTTTTIKIIKCWVLKGWRKTADLHPERKRNEQVFGRLLF
jgi:hypothetical protein